MNRADEIRAQAKRVGSKPSNRSEAGEVARKGRASSGATRTKAVGKTINLDPQLNGDVQSWQNGTAGSLGVGRVTFQETVTALLRELLSDEELAGRVAARIADRDG